MIMRAIPNDLKITMLLLILGVAGVGLGIPAMAAPIILLLPGYSLTTALFPGEGDLDEVERLLLIFGMSISIVPSLALVVNAFGFTLFGPGAPLFTALSSATILFTLISVIRRSRLNRPAWDFTIPDLKIRWITPVILIVVALQAISGIQGDKPIEFYLLDKNGRIYEDYYWQSLSGDQADTEKEILAMANGSTTPGATDWKQYSSNIIYVDVDTSSAGFNETPIYLTSLGGSSDYWQAEGVTSIYNSTATGFRVYVLYDGGSITPEKANSWGWHIQWIGTPKPDITAEAFMVVLNHGDGGKFTVEVEADGEIVEEHQFTLRGEEKWTQQFRYDILAQNGNKDKVIKFVIYRDREPIRRLHLLMKNE